MKAVVEMRNVSMTYQSPNGEVKALENINFTVYDGEFVCIVGPSGCGKSTLLSIISGLLAPTSGQTVLYGEALSGPSRKTGYMLQKDHLFEWRTILQNVLLGVEIQKALTPEIKQKAMMFLKTYGLYEFR
ncbi:MAG: ATP-binding cassette domain-containing protein, partial [Syntrophomonas sp.]